MKYIAYSVDPIALSTGIPVERLSRVNERVVEQGGKHPSDPGEFKNTKHLYQSNSTLSSLTCKEPSLLEVNDKTYQRILSEQLVQVTGGNPGQIYKVVNKRTGKFVMRRLYPIGEYKYFGRVVQK